MGFSVMLWGAEKLVPAEYWCPYGSHKQLVPVADPEGMQQARAKIWIDYVCFSIPFCIRMLKNKV